MLRRSTILASRAFGRGGRRALYIPGGGADPDRNNFSMKWVGLTGILAAVMLANSLDRKQEQEDELADSLGRARLHENATLAGLGFDAGTRVRRLVRLCYDDDVCK